MSYRNLRVLDLSGVSFVLGTTLAVILGQYSASPIAIMVAGVCAVAAVISVSLSDRSASIIFVLLGPGRAVLAAGTRDGGLSAVGVAIGQGSFVVALYTALTAIRIAATGSPAILEYGSFLASQRPGLHY